MNKVIAIDSGRYAVKFKRGQKFGSFKSIYAPGIELKRKEALYDEKNILLHYQGADHFVGEAAGKFGVGIQSRDEQKANFKNRVFVVAAASMLAMDGEELTLLTNIPLRDWEDGKDVLAESLKGEHEVYHKAGLYKDKRVRFNLSRVRVFAECESAFYGFVFDETGRCVHPELMNGTVIVLEIGNQTQHYSVFKNGEFIETMSGTTNQGVHVPLAQVQKWLEDQHVEMTIPEIEKAIQAKQPLMFRGNSINLWQESRRFFSAQADYILNDMAGKFDFNRAQYCLLGGGGAYFVKEQFEKAFHDLYCPNDAHLLNLKGMEIMNKLIYEV